MRKKWGGVRKKWLILPVFISSWNQRKRHEAPGKRVQFPVNQTKTRTCSLYCCLRRLSLRRGGHREVLKGETGGWSVTGQSSCIAVLRYREWAACCSRRLVQVSVSVWTPFWQLSVAPQSHIYGRRTNIDYCTWNYRGGVWRKGKVCMGILPYVVSVRK